MFKYCLRALGLSILVVCLISVAGCYVSLNEDIKEDIDLTINPDRGFYQAIGKKFTRADNQAISLSRLQQYSALGLFHFRFGLEDFSANMGGEDVLLTEDMLNALAETLDNLRLVDATAIIRFSYDIDGAIYNQGGGDTEPADLSLIEAHVKQLGEVLANYTDCITAIEAGMLGPWGEQHSTTLSGLPEAYFVITEAWLSNITTRTISLRRPRYCLYWYNLKYETDYKINEIESAIIPASIMVGVYNDGYLGSSSDLGTYSDRDKEINWLNNITNHTLFGGEVVADSGGEIIGAYNSWTHLVGEAKLTHTSYLNIGWNYNVINSWKETPYTGENKLYSQKQAFDYIASHLGYRLVMTKPRSFYKNNTLRIRFDIENKGFGNIVNEKAVYLVLTNDVDVFYIKTDIDAREFTEKQTISIVTDVSDFASGKYKAYLKIISADAQESTLFRSIKLANKDIWDASLAANYLGEVSI